MSSVNTMKAIQIHQYGGKEVLSYQDSPVPAIAENQILIKVIATSVNPVDWKIREGYLQQMIDYPMPFIPGWDVAGIVEQVGSQVRQFTIGDAVYSRPNIMKNGSYAEYIAVDAIEVASKPATLSFMEAASVPLAGITAWESLFTAADLQAGQTVLIHAGSGGVGSLAIQLAKHKGAKVITTTSAKNHDFVASLGADEVIDYTSVDFKTVVKAVDVVFDTVGGQVLQDSFAVIKPGGMLVSIVETPDGQKAAQNDIRTEFVMIQPNATILQQLADLIDSGHVRPIVGAEFGLADIAKAHELSQSGRAKGKIVIHVAAL
ncbi:MAG: NADPH:quinone reductase-like Zn-dependent oxidoreductase [Phenylobacterium sp.]|jgi:NADPH:quinone reductase-like Zn-dependent oxidoreductase